MGEIGFFGGSFDPLHWGHIYMAIQLMEKCHLKEVWFCPAFCSPFKMDTPPSASPRQRLEMLEAGLKGLPGMRVESFEIEKEGPSYSIDTLRDLKRRGTGNLRLILSEESAAHLFQWKEAQELIRLAPPLIGSREISSGTALPAELRKWAIPTHRMEISSTEIRQRIKLKLCCKHLAPPETLDYISRYNLYSC